MGLGPGLLRKNAREIGDESTAISDGGWELLGLAEHGVVESPELFPGTGEIPIAVDFPAVEIGP